MPPAIVESDVESVTSDSEPKKALKDVRPDDKEVEEVEDGDEEDEEEYIVEAIKDHRSDFEDGVLRYHVKWQGYEKKADRTWETEDTLEGAREILEAYWDSIGGKPDPNGPKPTKKRGRQSTGSQKEKLENGTTKRQRGNKAGRKSNGAVEQDVELGSLVGFTDVGDDDWKPPPAKDGSWDPLVQSIDTVVRESTDGELWAYLIWNEKNAEGRFYRSRAKLPVIYKACPQRMLHFYEKHLVFSTGNGDEDKNASS